MVAFSWSLTIFKHSNKSLLDFESNAPVGSSAKIISGLDINALHVAPRCFYYQLNLMIMVKQYYLVMSLYLINYNLEK